jgi:hypothetical protein
LFCGASFISEALSFSFLALRGPTRCLCNGCRGTCCCFAKSSRYLHFVRRVCVCVYVCACVCVCRVNSGPFPIWWLWLNSPAAPTHHHPHHHLHQPSSNTLPSMNPYIHPSTHPSIHPCPSGDARHTPRLCGLQEGHFGHGESGRQNQREETRIRADAATRVHLPASRVNLL